MRTRVGEIKIQLTGPGTAANVTSVDRNLNLLLSNALLTGAAVGF